MYISDLFRSPVDRIAAFAEVQLHLYRSDPALQDYFEALQLDTSSGTGFGATNQRQRRLVKLGIHLADKVSQLRPHRKIKADVLYCPSPDFSRKAEIEFLIRTLIGLAETGATIACLIAKGAPCYLELQAQLKAIARDKQVTFVDPADALNQLPAAVRSRLVKMRARAAFEEVVEILEPHGLTPGKEVEASFARLAYFAEAWERLEQWIEFDAAVARCHWHALGSPVCRTARRRDKSLMTFQQGVIGTTLDVPVTASTYVAFGQPSASLVAQMNTRFYQAAGEPEPAVDYVHGGCLFDRVDRLPDQFELRTLLMVDVPVPTSDFHGTESQGRALLELAGKLLSSNRSLRRLIIRPHPYWNNLDFETCKRLVRSYPSRCELSHPAWSLDDDLRRSSIVAGIWSGVLTVASACGLPTIFLQTDTGFKTADLTCFSANQTLAMDEAYCRITQLMENPEAYHDASARAREDGSKYYAGGKNVDLSAAFFESLLGQKSKLTAAKVN